MDAKEIIALASKSTDQDKERAIEAFKKRKANPPEQIDNSRLDAGSPMHFYCKECGYSSEIKPESYTSSVKTLCEKCQVLKDKGWLAEAKKP